MRSQHWFRQMMAPSQAMKFYGTIWYHWGPMGSMFLDLQADKKAIIWTKVDQTLHTVLHHQRPPVLIKINLNWCIDKYLHHIFVGWIYPSITKFNMSLAKLPLNSGHGCAITSSFLYGNNYLSILWIWCWFNWSLLIKEVPGVNLFTVGMVTSGQVTHHVQVMKVLGSIAI